MKQINMRILTILAIFFVGCSTTSKVTTADKTREDLRDVFILTILARDYLRNTDKQDFDLEKLIEYDSLSRISKILKKLN
jgi:hypothetical protein